MPHFRVMLLQAGERTSGNYASLYTMQERGIGDAGELPNGDAVFTSGGAAASAARMLTEYHAIQHAARYRWTPQPYDMESVWQMREQMKIDRGNYKLPCWFNETWFLEHRIEEHYLHVSQTNPALVAYTQDPIKGAADIQTPLRPGVYLSRFFSEVLSPETIEHWANKHVSENAPPELRFATTPDEIESVYRNGPGSCMSADASHYDSSCHPTRVYGAGDLAIGYLRNGSERATARAVCWPEKKIFTPYIYGDWQKLRAAFAAAGFNEGTLEGARLVRIPERGGFVCPYLDGTNSVNDNGENLIISRNGEIFAGDSGATGLCGVERYDSECHHCGREYNSNEEGGYVDDRDAYYCDSCLDDTVICDATGNRVADYVTLSDGSVWSESYYDDHGFTCDSCDHIGHCDESSYDEPTGDTLCESCIADRETEREEEAEREREEAEEAEREEAEREARGWFTTRATTPTINDPRQIVAALPIPEELFEVAYYAKVGGALVGLANFDLTGRISGTREEAEALARQLQVGNDYYRFTARRKQPQALARGVA